MRGEIGTETDSVKQGMYGRSLEEIPSLMRDPQYISELTPVVETEREKVVMATG